MHINVFVKVNLIDFIQLYIVSSFWFSRSLVKSFFTILLYLMVFYIFYFIWYNILCVYSSYVLENSTVCTTKTSGGKKKKCLLSIEYERCQFTSILILIDASIIFTRYLKLTVIITFKSIRFSDLYRPYIDYYNNILHYNIEILCFMIVFVCENNWYIMTIPNNI